MLKTFPCVMKLPLIRSEKKSANIYDQIFDIHFFQVTFLHTVSLF